MDEKSTIEELRDRIAALEEHVSGLNENFQKRLERLESAKNSKVSDGG